MSFCSSRKVGISDCLVVNRVDVAFLQKRQFEKAVQLKIFYVTCISELEINRSDLNRHNDEKYQKMNTEL